MRQSAALAALIASPRMVALHEVLAGQIEASLDTAIRIQQIPAPTFAERERAAFVLEQFKRISGLDSLATDELHNVYARLPGTEPERGAVLVSAHTDTVFGAHTPLDARREGSRIHGPGIGDNSMGVAALLAAAELLSAHRWPAPIWFVANTREEGLGDLGGIRAVEKRLAGQIAHAIVIEGMALGRVYHAGIAVRRLRITCHGPGGHSWLHFGRPSAIHGLVRLGARIAALHPPDSPRTTFNIGVIEGGTSVNTIAAEAAMLLDLRSVSPESLAALERTVRAMLEQGGESDLHFGVEVVGDRPAGSIPVSHPLVQLADHVLAHLGIRASFETGSTDANALLAAGIPTVTIGITNGSNAHRLDEYIDIEGVHDGLWQLVLLAAAAATGLADD